MNRPKVVPTAPKRTTRPRGTTTQRGYGYAHQKLRRHILSVRPLCEICDDAISTDLHHVDGNPFNHYPDNLQALCESCHHGVAHG